MVKDKASINCVAASVWKWQTKFDRTIVNIGEWLRNPLCYLFGSLFSTVTLHKTKTFLHILDNGPMKTFGCGHSSITSSHETKDCAGLRSYSTSMFALLSAPASWPSSITIPIINYDTTT